jgi:hypothetical protein
VSELTRTEKKTPEERTNQKMPAAALSGHLFLSQETSSLILLLPKVQGEQELPGFYPTLSIGQSVVEEVKNSARE